MSETLVKESVPNFVFSSPIAVAMTATALSAGIPGYPEATYQKGILILAPDSNSEIVYIRDIPNVTADQAATGGFPLNPGRHIVLPIERATRIYHIATDTNQKLHAVVV